MFCLNCVLVLFLIVGFCCGVFVVLFAVFVPAWFGFGWVVVWLVVVGLFVWFVGLRLGGVVCWLDWRLCCYGCVGIVLILSRLIVVFVFLCFFKLLHDVGLVVGCCRLFVCLFVMGCCFGVWVLGFVCWWIGLWLVFLFICYGIGCVIGLGWVSLFVDLLALW